MFGIFFDIEVLGDDMLFWVRFIFDVFMMVI